MSDFPRRTLAPLVALVPILAVAASVAALVHDLSWYVGLTLFYLALAVAEIGYLGLLILEDRWRDRTLDASLRRQL